MGLNWKQFELGVLRPVLKDASAAMSRPEQAVLLVGETIWHESDKLRALGQYPRDPDAVFGPGMGPCSMEGPTWDWLVADFISKDVQLEKVFKRWCTSGRPSHDEFSWNLALNVLGCRLRYWANPAPMPMEADIEQRSHLWFAIYNGSGVESRRLRYCQDAEVIPWEVA